MEKACQDDNEARDAGKPAVHKLAMLPEVIALLNRTTVQHSIVDPDTNFLQSVRFFLEPLNDGSLPAYNIQRDLFAALAKLPIEKDALLASGIGKLITYYLASKKPEQVIRRQAETLKYEWSRPILKRSDDYKTRKIEERAIRYVYFCPTVHTLLMMRIALVLSPAILKTRPRLRRNAQERKPKGIWTGPACWHLFHTPTAHD